MRRTLYLLFLLWLPVTAFSQFCGLNGNIAFINDSVQTINIDISSYVNNDLSSPTQGICEVKLNFRHINVKHLELFLVSPTNDTVQLIGPRLPPGLPTLGNTKNFDISFLPCGSTVGPDPFQSNNWNNNNDFSQIDNYIGSYYPFSGCLEDFNSGPVNGQWKIIYYTLDPFPTLLLSEFFEVELIFCDDEGNPCCDANAGTFNEIPLMVCEGDPALIVSPAPVYAAGPPDPLEYGFTYMIFKNGVLDSLTDNPDLTSYEGGQYEVCGLSYRLSDSLNLPDPANNITLTALRSDLASNGASICADISTECLEITIIGPSQTNLNETICAGDSFSVGMSTYTSSGVYRDTLPNFIGCDSIIVLDLLVIDTLKESFMQTICNGDSINFGGQFLASAGVYSDTLKSVGGCDSVAIMTLFVEDVLVRDTAATICSGEAIFIGADSFTVAGIHEVTFTTNAGCDSIVRLNLQVLAPQVVFGPVDTISCNNPTVTLDGSASTPLMQVGFTWLDESGQVIGNNATVDVSRGEAYSLIVTQNSGGKFCSIRDTIIVEADTLIPISDAGTPDTLSCQNTNFLIGSLNSSQDPDVEYEWSTTDGNIVSGDDQIQALIDAPGTYTLLVRKTSNGCTDVSSVRIEQDINVPTALIAAAPDLSCLLDSLQLDGSGSAQGPNIAYTWSSLGANPITNGNTVNPTIFFPDTYQLLVSDIITGCSDSTTIVIATDTLKPVSQIAPVSDTLSCVLPTITLDATGSDNGPGFTFLWRSLNGGRIISGANTLNPVVDTAGIYRLIVQNTSNGCSYSSEVEVLENLVNVIALIAKSNDLTCTLSEATLDAKGSFPLVGGTYQWSTPDGNILGGTNQDIIMVDQPGTYQVVVQDIASSCKDSTTVQVVVDTLRPTAEAGPGFTLNCTISNAPLNSAGSSFGPEFDYFWTGPCIVSGENTGAPIVDCGGTYILTITNLNNGCVAQDSVVILDETAPPVADAGPDTIINCFNPSIRLDGTNSAAGIGLNYQWTGPGFLDGETTNTPLINQSGTYVLDIINTSTGCTNSDTVVVSVDTLRPVADAGSPQLVDCNTLEATLGGNMTSIGNELQYEWTSPDGRLTGPSDSIFTFTDSAGFFQLKVLNTINGCQDSATVQITFDQDFPVVDAGADKELNCLVDTAIIGNSLSNPEVVFSWSGNACFLGPTNQPQTVVNCSGVFILEARDINSGCITTDTVEVIDNIINPTAVLPDSAFISCVTGSVLLDASASGGGLLNWFFEGNLIAQDTNMLEVSDTGIYKLVVGDPSFGCSDSTEVIVSLDCSVSASIVNPLSLTCERQLVLLDGSASMVGTDSARYEWRGPSNACILNGRDSLIAEVACPGTYTLLVTNLAVGIMDSAVVVVNIDTISPVADAGLPSMLTCDNPTALLDANGSSSGLGTSFLWFTFDDDTLSNALTTTVDSAGVYIFEIIDGRNGCSARDIVEITEDRSVPAISFANTTFPCVSDSLRLEAILDPVAGNYSLQWTGPSILADSDSLRVLIGVEGTYSLTVENNDNGCVVQSDVLVTPEDCPPCVTVALPDTIRCNMPVVDLTATLCETCVNCSFAWQTNDGSIIAGTNTLNAQVDAPGNYTLVVSNNDNGLSTTLRVEVFGDTLAPIVNAGLDQNLNCANPRLDIIGMSTGTNLSYRWFESGNNALTLSTDSIVSINQIGTYTFEVTNVDNGCFNTDEISIGIDTLSPISEAGPPKLINCIDDFARLEGENSSTGFNFLYEWSSSPGGNIQTGINSANPIVNTGATYFLIITDANNGCTAIDSVLVTEDTAPPAIQPINDEMLNCNQTDVVLQGNLPAQGNFTPQWCLLNEMGDTVFCQNTIDLQVSDAGNYRFSVLNEDSGCSNETIVVVGVDTLSPLVDAGTSQDLTCTTASLDLEGFLISGEANIDILWTAQNGSQISDSFNLQTEISSPDIYYLNITNTDNGCVGIDSIFVNLDDRFPTVSINPPDLINCNQSDIRLDASAVAATNRLGALWSTADGQFIGSFDILNPRVRQAGTYILTITDLGNGCVIQDSVEVLEDFQAPDVVLDTLDGTLITCDNDIIDLSFAASTSASGLDLDFIYKLNGLDLPSSPPLTGTNVAGNYEVIGIDPQNGCQDTVRFQINQNTTVPAIGIMAAPALSCNQSSSRIDATNSVQGNQYLYQWTGPGAILPTIDPLVIEVTDPGTYQLMITDTLNGCTSMANAVVVLDTMSPFVQIAEPLLLDCQNVLIELDGSATGSGGGYIFEWTSVLGGEIISGLNSSVARVDSAGVYTLRVTDTRNGCTGTGVVNVVNDGQPIGDVDFTILPPDCRGDGTGEIQVGAITGGVGPFSFAMDSDLFLTQNFFRNLSPDTTHILKVMDSRGCIKEVSFSFPEITPLEVELGPDQNINLGDSIRIEALVNRGYDSLRWSPFGTSGDPSQAMQVLKPLETTVYKVFVRDSLECTAEGTVIITVNTPESLFFPTAFSPDGNGNNDVYYIFADDDVQQIKTFFIFDRWGTLVFEQTNFQPNDPNFGWDGTFKGRRMKPAVFVFTAEVEYIDGRTELLKGDFVLLNR